jgi:hypothetical protein
MVDDTRVPSTDGEAAPTVAVSEADLAAYLEDMIDELRRVAEREGLRRLGALLKLARDEAHTYRVPGQ